MGISERRESEGGETAARAARQIGGQSRTAPKENKTGGSPLEHHSAEDQNPRRIFNRVFHTSQSHASMDDPRMDTGGIVSFGPGGAGCLHL